MPDDDHAESIAREVRRRALSADPESLLLTDEDIDGWPSAVVDGLLRDGRIRASQPSALAECRECDDWHWEPVQWLGGNCFISCGRFGLVAVVPASLQRWSVTPEDVDRGHSSPARTSPESAHYVFRRRADYWELRYGTAPSFSIRDAKGVRDIWVLLQSPGCAISATELVRTTSVGISAAIGAANGLTVDNGGGLPLADTETLAALQHKLEDLKEELAAARDRGDLDAVTEFADEQTKLTRYISAATNQYGKPRMSAGHRDKARTAVKNRIVAAIRKIEEHSREMAMHLDSSIQTGANVTYQPATALDWQLV